MATEQGLGDVFVIRSGEKLSCAEACVPTADGLAFADDKANRKKPDCLSSTDPRRPFLHPLSHHFVDFCAPQSE